jgi:hypothetical protein
MLWLLIILNQAGGDIETIYFSDEILCEAAATEADALPYAGAVCIYVDKDEAA